MLWVWGDFRLFSLFFCYSIKVYFERGPSKTLCTGFLVFRLAILYLYAELFRSSTLLHSSATRLAPVRCQEKMCKLSFTGGQDMRHF